MPNQPQLDGSIISGPDHTNFNELTELQEALTQFGWSIKLQTKDKDGYVYFELINGSRFIKLHIYLKKVAWRHRSVDEKGVQFSSSHLTTGYTVAQSNVEKTIVFGIYKNSAFNDTLICAWDPFEWGKRGNSFNCFIDVHALAEAYQIGFVRDTKKKFRVYSFRPELIHYYIANRDLLHDRQVSIVHPLASPVEKQVDLPWNKIIYGAPGTGKSYVLREQALAAGFFPENTTRVTFHPSYSYQQLIGSYKPSPIYREQPGGMLGLFKSDRVTTLTAPFDKEPLIDYTFVAGPLLHQLINALTNPDNDYLLIIEEINRANVAAVFGDVFQLLDRSSSGESEYEIDFSPEVCDFISAAGITGKKVRLPGNLYLWATMNSADQGVLPLDAAFKRRWTFEYLPLDDKEDVVANRTASFQKKRYKWNSFRHAINDHLKSIPVPEDKLLGPFFLNSKELNDEAAIKNKLLLYLRDDVLRHNPESLFKKSAFSDIIKDYDAGNSIFNDFILPKTITEEFGEVYSVDSETEVESRDPEEETAEEA